jgi:hypothetical protein
MQSSLTNVGVGASIAVVAIGLANGIEVAAGASAGLTSGAILGVAIVAFYLIYFDDQVLDLVRRWNNAD